MKLRNIFIMIGLTIFTACSDNDSEPVVEPVTGPTEVQLISFNILPIDATHTGDLDWKQRRKALLNLINTERPDVMCMQGQLWNQVVYIEQQLPDYTMIDHNADGDDSNRGRHNSIMFRTDKYTLLGEGRYWLSQRPTSASYPWSSLDEERRITTWVLLKDNQTKAQFYVATTLMNDGDESVDHDARLNSANLNVDKMKTFLDDQAEKIPLMLDKIPMILTGDMNASYSADDSRRDCLAPYYDYMTDARTAADTDSKPSYNALGQTVTNGRLQPDIIFMRDAQPLSFRTLDGNYGVSYISDHFPISCKIKL